MSTSQELMRQLAVEREEAFLEKAKGILRSIDDHKEGLDREYTAISQRIQRTSAVRKDIIEAIDAMDTRELDAIVEKWTDAKVTSTVSADGNNFTSTVMQEWK